MSEAVKPEVLISRLTSSNETWRVEAEVRLIQLGAPAVEPLIHALRHASASVRLHAVHALMRIGDPRGISPVLGCFADGENFGAVAIAAEHALVAWGEPARPALLEAARSEVEAIRARAIRALGKIGGDSLIEPLRAMLTDSSSAIRTQAAVALASIGGERAIEWIAPLLADADKWVRWEVAEALVQQGSVRGEAALREAAEDPDEQGSHTQFWAEELLDAIDELRRTGRARE